MNPDKLFDYLDGRLPEHERRGLEEQLMNEPQLRRELEVARRIHAGMRNTRTERPEVLSETVDGVSRHGGKLGPRVLAAAAFLVALNVGFGLYIIARHERANPNRELLKKQSEEQLRQLLEKATAGALTPPPIGVLQLRVSVEPGRGAAVAEEIVQLAQRLGGAATKGLPDSGRIELLVEIARMAEFKNALTAIAGVHSVTGGESAPEAGKVSVIIEVIETK